MSARAVIATTTFYKSVEELRFKLACLFVAAARKLGYSVVIVDGSPGKEVAEILRGLGALVYPQLHKGMGPGRREAFFHAREVAFQVGAIAIAWVEPEKVDFIQSIEGLIEKIAMGFVDIVIPRRSGASWQTWPAFQVESEKEANSVYNKVFGLKDFDPMFGPVLFSIEAAPYFVLCYVEGVEDTYIQHYAPRIASREGAQVVSVEVDMTYPPEQKEEEEGALNEAMLEKRRDQRDSLIQAYVVINRRY